MGPPQGSAVRPRWSTPWAPLGGLNGVDLAPSQPWRRTGGSFRTSGASFRTMESLGAGDRAFGTGSGPSRCRPLSTCQPAGHPLWRRRRGVLVTVVGVCCSHDLLNDLVGAGHCGVGGDHWGCPSTDGRLQRCDGAATEIRASPGEIEAPGSGGGLERGLPGLVDSRRFVGGR